MTTPHDTQHNWPFPRLDVIVRAVTGETATPKLSAYIDTGADITLIPSRYLEPLQAEALYTANLRGYGGNACAVTLFLVDLEVAGHLLPGVEVVGDTYDDVPLLGRNVLNKLHLLISGPEQQTALLSPALAARTLQRAEREA